MAPLRSCPWHAMLTCTLENVGGRDGLPHSWVVSVDERWFFELALRSKIFNWTFADAIKYGSNPDHNQLQLQARRWRDSQKKARMTVSSARINSFFARQNPCTAPVLREFSFTKCRFAFASLSSWNPSKLLLLAVLEETEMRTDWHEHRYLKLT